MSEPVRRNPSNRVVSLDIRERLQEEVMGRRMSTCLVNTQRTRAEEGEENESGQPITQYL